MESGKERGKKLIPSIMKKSCDDVSAPKIALLYLFLVFVYPPCLNFPMNDCKYIETQMQPGGTTTHVLPFLLLIHVILLLSFCDMSRLSLCPFRGLVYDLLLRRLKAYSPESALIEEHLASQSERALRERHRSGLP